MGARKRISAEARKEAQKKHSSKYIIERRKK